MVILFQTKSRLIWIRFTLDENMKQVILIRKDLNMSRGKEIAQACHASMKATLEHMEDERVKTWLSGMFKKVALVVENEEELIRLHQLALEKGLITSLIEDSGLTYFHGVKTKTTVAIGPDEEEKINELTGHLKLR